MRLVRVMALVALKFYLRAAAGVPVAVSPAMYTCLPVSVGYPVTLPAQKDRFIARYLAAVVINICCQVCAVMAVEAAHVQPVIEHHITVRTERHVE